MVGKRRHIVVLAALLLALGACAPKTAPTPTLTIPQAPAPTSVVAAPTPVKISPEEAEWQKVIEAAKKEGKVTHYGAGIVGDIATSVARAFQRKYGIKVEIVAGTGAVHIERIKAESRGGKYIADMIDTSAVMMVRAKDEGLTVSVADLPELREKNVWSLVLPKADPEGHIIAYSIAVFPVFINTNLVKPGEEPRSYRDFLEPRWRADQITHTSPVASTAIISLYVAAKKAGTLDDDFWRRLGLKGVRIAPSLREPPSWLSRGEVAVTLDTGEATMAPYAKEGAPVKAIEMAEGVPVSPVGRTISLIKNGPHPNAARVFVNWLLSQEGQQFYNEAAGGLSPVRKDNPDLRPAALRTEMKKPLLIDLALTLEAAKVQREFTLAKLLGLEK